MHKFNPENWEHLLGAERRTLIDPARFVDQLNIREGDVVADLGAGPGFFTLPLAERVGAGGKVYALDVAPDMLAQLRLRHLPKQVELLLSTENHLPLPDGSVDLGLLAFVFHELENPAEFLAEAKRILRPSGRLVLVEWVPQEEELGPPLHARIGAEDSARALIEAGFRVLTDGMIKGSTYYFIAEPVFPSL